MTYIYLITYTDGSLYVGSHTWKGPKGQLDPNYHGSSGVAKRFNLKIKTEEILEIVSEDRKLIAEREWIEYYASLFGLSNKALSLTHNHKDSWRNSFPSGGRVINLHANNAQAARDANRLKMLKEGFTSKQKTAASKSIKIAQKASVLNVKKNGLTSKQKEALSNNQKKAISILKLNGPSIKKQEHGRKAIIKAREASQKKRREGLTHLQRQASLNAVKLAQTAAQSKLKSGGPTAHQINAYKSNNCKRTVAAHLPESMTKMVNTRKLNNSYVTCIEKRNKTSILNRQNDKSYGKTRIVKVTYEGAEYTGSVKRVCKYIGYLNWSCTVSKKIKNSDDKSIIHNGVCFEIIDCK